MDDDRFADEEQAVGNAVQRVGPGRVLIELLMEPGRQAQDGGDEQQGRRQRCQDRGSLAGHPGGIDADHDGEAEEAAAFRLIARRYEPAMAEGVDPQGKGKEGQDQPVRADPGDVRDGQGLRQEGLTEEEGGCQQDEEAQQERN